MISNMLHDNSKKESWDISIRVKAKKILHNELHTFLSLYLTGYSLLDYQV